MGRFIDEAYSATIPPMVARTAQSEFLKKAIARHGDRYDYSRSVYATQSTTIEVICPIHGPFEQKAKDHLKGSGCRKCGTTRAREARLLTTEMFVGRAIEIHGNKYDYSRVQYIGDKSPVDVYCREHDIWFKQHPGRHVNVGASSCPKCFSESVSRARTKTTEGFIADATVIHGDRFDYGGTIYVGAQKKLWITCRTHGPFEQLATNHLAGYGCQECAVQRVFHERHIPKGERNDPAWVYVMRIDVDDRLYAKLGYTTDFGNRLAHLKSERVFVDKSTRFETTKFFGFQTERNLHGRFKAHRNVPLRRFGGATECYPVSMFDQLALAVKTEIVDGSEPGKPRGWLEDGTVRTS